MPSVCIFPLVILSRPNRHPQCHIFPLFAGESLLLALGEYGEARVIYEDVLDKNPKSSAAANNLAFYYAEHEPTEKNLSKAEKLIGPLLEKFKDNPDVVDTAAWIYYRKSDFETARDLLLGVEEKIGSRPIVNYHLGMIYLSLGNQAEARQHLQLATQGQEQYSGRKEAEKTLKTLS